MNSQESVKLDQIVKSLFDVSSKAMIGVINECFHKSYDPERVIVEKLKSNFVKENLDYETIDADIILKINGVKYHIEFQTRNDKTMEIRMFEYGFYIAKEDARLEEDGIMTLYVPNQAVIFIEENSEIRDQKVRIVFPDGQETVYAINTVRFWKYSVPMLREKHMYNLLPLTIFNHRKALARVVDNQPKLLKEKEKLKEEINDLSEAIKVLIKENALEGEDVHKIALAMTNLTEYLNSKYIKDEDFDKEVIQMTKTLYDPLVEQRGREEGIKEGIKEGVYKVAKRLILKGSDVDTIVEMTELSIEEIQELKKSL